MEREDRYNIRLRTNIKPLASAYHAHTLAPQILKIETHGERQLLNS